MPVAPAPVAYAPEPVDVLPEVSGLRLVANEFESVTRWGVRIGLAAVGVAAAGAAFWLARDNWSPVSDTISKVASSVGPPGRQGPPPARTTADLAVRSTPDGATVLVDGVERGTTPATFDDLAPGAHRVTLKSGDGTVEREVQLVTGSLVTVEEAIFPGWMRVVSTIDLQIAEGARAIALNEESTALLPAGSHTLRFENRDLSYSATREVLIKPGETTPVSIVPEKSRLTVTATLPAEVFINGVPAGRTPLTDAPVDVGMRDITVRSESGIERRFTIAVGSRPARLDVDFSGR